MPKYEMEIQHRTTPDQQQAPCFARDEQKASLGVLLMVVKCKI